MKKGRAVLSNIESTLESDSPKATPRYAMASPEVARRIVSITESDIKKSLFVELFSNKPKRNADGKVYGVLPPYCTTDEVIIVEANTLPNIKVKTTTTIGRYIFNLFCISSIFGETIPYINKSLAKNGIGDVQQIIVDLIMEKKATPEQFAKFQNRLIWLNNFGELFIPGFSYRLLTPLPEVQKRKAELIEQYKDEIASGDYVRVVAKIEKELLAVAKEVLKDDPSWPIYEMGGKPSFGNNYKNTQVIVGPIMDPIEGKYKISPNSLADGIPKDQYDIYANMLVAGSYSRGVATQDGGAKTKTLFAAMQSVVLGEPGTDCKTTILKTITIPEKGYRSLLYRYIVDEEGALTLLTLENIKEFAGKTVKMRSPMYCKSKEICNVCAGDMFYRIGIRNIGLTVTKITSTLLNLSLKSMHDATVKTTEFDPFKFMRIVQET